MEEAMNDNDLYDLEIVNEWLENLEVNCWHWTIQSSGLMGADA